MSVTSVQLWDAIYRLGADDLTADGIPAAVIAKLVEFKMATVDTAGVSQLTTYGAKCFTVIESGDGTVPELNTLAALEVKQGRRDNSS